MTIETANLKNALVMRDAAKTWRLYDAFGAGVTKHIEDFVSWNTDDTTGDPTAYTMTVVEVGAGNSTAVLTQVAGGAMLMTAAANENDGVQIQLKNSESFQLNGGYPCYYGVNLSVADADQTDVLFGLAIQDTTAIAGLSDGVYFRSVDEAATVQFVLEKDSAETSNSVATLSDGVAVTLEFYYDGSNISAYVDGVLAATVANTDTNFPNDEPISPICAMLTGEAVANTVTVNWMRAIQVRA